MFTIDRIKEAHAKVKSGADFPAYVKELKTVGVEAYHNYVADGTTVYYGANGFELKSAPKYDALKIADTGAIDTLKQQLKVHQQGGTNYLTFCGQAADAGVYKWVVDLAALTCVYYDKQGTAMLEEKIPAA